MDGGTCTHARVRLRCRVDASVTPRRGFIALRGIIGLTYPSFPAPPRVSKVGASLIAGRSKGLRRETRASQIRESIAPYSRNRIFPSSVFSLSLSLSLSLSSPALFFLTVRSLCKNNRRDGRREVRESKSIGDIGEMRTGSFRERPFNEIGNAARCSKKKKRKKGKIPRLYAAPVW